jgi:uncharacterized protein
MPGSSLQWELNPKLVVQESPIAGFGLYAIGWIERGVLCCRLAGEVMTDDEFGRYVRGRDHYSALAIDEGVNLVQSDDDPTTKGNHSCDPNMWMADAVTVVACRPVRVGDEATIDYALMTVDPAWAMLCNCQADLCRHVVTGNDWRLVELRTRYRGHWSPFIERRFRNAATSA